MSLLRLWLRDISVESAKKVKHSVMQADPQTFDRIREGLARKYQNANMKPDRHASYLRLRALKHLWHVDDILLELNSLTPAAVQASCHLN